MNQEQKDAIVLDLGSAYLFNLIFIANEEDEGGFDAPLESKYSCLTNLIEVLQSQGLLATESYEEDGESGEEYIPSDKGVEFIEDLKATSDHYLQMRYSEDQVENIRKAFFDAMSSGKIHQLDESQSKWYQQISSFDFYESLVPEAAKKFQVQEEVKPKQAPRSFREESAVSAIEINEKKEVENSTRRYMKPALIHGSLALLGLLFVVFGWSWAIVMIITFGALAGFYYTYTVSIYDGKLISKSWLGERVIRLDQIGETTLKEEGDDLNSFEIIGENGVSIEVSSWLEDVSGFRYLILKIAEEQ